MASVKIAFSGGMESTYLAQMFLEKEFLDLELYFGAIAGVTPDPLEASLVYRNYKKLQELYPKRSIQLRYVNKSYFETSDYSGSSINYVNQAFRVACLCTDITREEGNYLVACGWTGDGNIENTLNPGGYTKDDYLEMLQLPRKLNHLSRQSPFPHTIQAPLWGVSKAEIFNKLNPALRDYVVVNNRHGRVVDNKLDEYDSANLPHPSYIEDKHIKEDVINGFGKYFYDSQQWGEYFKQFVEVPYSALDLMSPRHPRLIFSIKAEDMIRNVLNFEITGKEMLTAYREFLTTKEVNTDADKANKNYL